MKRHRRDDFTLFHRRKVFWDSDLFNFLFKLKYYFIAAKVFGLNDYPHEVLKTKVSTFGRKLSLLMSLISLALSVKSVVYFCIPSLVSAEDAVLKQNAEGNPIRYILPLFSLSMTILRYRVAGLLRERTYLVEMRQIAFKIIDDPVLSALKVKPWKVQIYLCASIGFISITLIGGVVSAMNFRAEQWKSPVFYFSILEFTLYYATNFHAACYVLITGFHVGLPLLHMTASEFEEAAKTMDVWRLHRAIRCHETCCRLIEVIDRIAGHFLGFMLVVAVPQIALTISNLDKLSRNSGTLRQALTAFLGQAFLVIVFLMLASGIHREAERPREVLSSNVYMNKEFEILSCQFMRRYQNRIFGFTFFGFVTLRKVLNIITTYLIVALQMKLS